MADFSWLAGVEDLSPAALTVRAQALSPNDQGRLLWDVFFPRRDVDSTDLRDVTTLDRRPAADRREWNARGRRIPMLTPEMRELQIVPIEANDQVMEQEIQKLYERTLGNQQMIQQIVGASIPARSQMLAESDYRRLELDAMRGWATGNVVQRNPETGVTYTAPLGIDGSRYTTPTAWTSTGYAKSLAFFEAAQDLAGPGAGLLMRRATANAILATAPTLAGGTTMTRAELANRISQDLGAEFNFFIVEHTVDVFTDGGTAVTREKVWPDQTVAFVPAGNQVGNTLFAPVVRAMELARQVPGAGIDIRGVTVYYDQGNLGRMLEIEAQLNALSVPDPQKVVVASVGV
jgi:hypothetical protein